jgi:hypothetical protein
MNSVVWDTRTLPGGDVVAGGFFTTAGGVSASGVARWDGTAWHPLGTGASSVDDVLVLQGGDVVASGFFTMAGGVSADKIARWDGVSWSSFVHGDIRPTRLDEAAQLPNGDIVATGIFTSANGATMGHIASWDGAVWSMLGVASNSAANNWVRACTELPNGNLVVGGDFTLAGAVNANNIAMWDGLAWAPLGTGPGGPVHAVRALANGEVIAGGDFGGGIARWDGSSWNQVGMGLTGPVLAIEVLANGDLIAGGYLAGMGCIARWDGISWSPLGTGLSTTSASVSASVKCITQLPNGDLVVGGRFTHAGGASANNIARWDGVAWSSFGTGVTGTDAEVYAMTTLSNGSIVVGGWFTAAGGVAAGNVARWNGASWSALGTGVDSVQALCALPNGDVVVGARLRSVAGVYGLRWNGVSWSAIGAGVDNEALAIVPRRNGDLAFGGKFLTAEGAVSAYLARLTTTCPATATAYGTGCTGPAGPLSLAATSMPWLGGTFRSRATGFGPGSVAVSVMGLGLRNMPLSTLTPIGLPNCDLLSTLNVAEAHTPAAGAVDFGLVVPNSPALVGATFYHQFLQLELGTQGQLVSLSSSNGLALRLGAF